MQDVSGIEKLLDEFLKELSVNPIHFYEPKNGFVTEEYYYKKFGITNLNLNELIYHSHKDGFVSKLTKPHDESGSSIYYEASINLKGKAFLKSGGYRRRKFWDKIKRYANLMNIIVLCIAAIVGMVWAGFQIKDRAQSKQVPVEQKER